MLVYLTAVGGGVVAVVVVVGIVDLFVCLLVACF